MPYGDQSEEMTLHQAAKAGQISVWEALLENSAKINIQDEYGNTVLHYAIANNHLDIALTLLKRHDIKINIKNKHENTPLHYAAGNGYIDIVKALLEKGANANAVGIYRKTALHLAAGKGYQDIVEVLLAAGARD